MLNLAFSVSARCTTASTCRNRLHVSSSFARPTQIVTRATSSASPGADVASIETPTSIPTTEGTPEVSEPAVVPKTKKNPPRTPRRTPRTKGKSFQGNVRAAGKVNAARRNTSKSASANARDTADGTGPAPVTGWMPVSGRDRGTGSRNTTPRRIRVPNGQAADGGFLLALKDAQRVPEWIELVKARDMNRSATELSASLTSLRRISRNTQPQFGPAVLTKLSEFLHVTKAQMGTWPPRTMSTVVMSLVSLGAGDKVLMVKTLGTMRKAIFEDPASYKLIELAQICWACKEMRFRNTQLMDCVAKGIAAAGSSDVNPTSVTNLLQYISSLEYLHPPTMDKLLDHCIAVSDYMTPAMYEKAFTSCSRLHYLGAHDKLVTLQANLCRNRRTRINPLDVLTVFSALLRVKSLQESTFKYLRPILDQPDDAWTRGQLKMLHEISVRLEKQGMPELGLSGTVTENMRRAGTQVQPVRNGAVAAIRTILKNDLKLQVQSTTTSHGFNIPILVNKNTAINVTSRLHYMTNDPKKLGGVSQLLESALEDDGLKIVWVPMDPKNKKHKTRDLKWSSSSPENRALQIEYLKSVLPKELLA